MKRKKVLCMMIISALFAGSAWAQESEKKIAELLQKMTLDEKIGQMSQRMPWSGKLEAEYAGWIRSGAVGSFLNAGGTNDWQLRNEFQKIAVEESRLGIPLIYGRDVIHGYRTILPIPLGQSCTWNPDLVEKGARMAAVEASADGIHWTFAPMVDISRDPRWGRIAESLGEDPYLASQLSAALVKGFQGRSLDDPTSIVACAKHYVGYGAAEGGRDYNTTWIPERLLRDVYLPPFHAAVKAGVGTLMSAFNDLNGVPASGNPFTLRQVLREEWKFDGFVVSDWESMTEMINHGFCKDKKEVAFKSIYAGVDMEMISNAYASHLKELVQEGLVDEKMIDQLVANILRIKMRKGLFDRPYNDGAHRDKILSQEHKEIAYQAALESAVLLKNEGILPLKANAKVAVIGPLTDSPVDQMGCWVLDGDAQAVVTPKKAFEERLGKNCFYAPGLKTSRDVSRSGFKAAVAAAKKADVVLLVLGEEQILSGEAHSRAFLNLPGAQEELVAEIAKTGKPIVTVIMAGRPLTFQNVTAKSKAVLYYFHPGTMGGAALFDLVFGKTSPSGRLSVTFPRTVGQIPLYYSHKNTGRPPSPTSTGIPMGTPLDPQDFTSKYLDVDFTPEYPFGYGLTYGKFKYENLQVSQPTVKKDGELKVSADITNIGNYEATEVVQLYIRDLFGSVTRPVKELKGFKRVTLKPGEKQTVTFTLKAADCGFHGLDNTYIVEAGDFKVWIGWNAQEGLEGSFAIVD
ncbi:MAG: beta-glucosidase BglX [candidate division KSB1 bacterium]|nr:beta-glucosidase BglX [candidate division KSB1 bacterium]